MKQSEPALASKQKKKNSENDKKTPDREHHYFQHWLALGVSGEY